VLEQAAGFAFLAALSPTVLLVGATYLGSDSPRRTVLYYLAGAVLMSVVMGVVVLLALHAGGLNHPRQRQPRYGLRLGLGVLALGAALFVALRKRKRAGADGKQGRLVARLMTRPKPVTAFLAGVILFAPSVSFIAAVQVIATARAGTGLIVAGIALIVVINVMLVWLPLAGHLAAPDATTRRLRAFNGWLRAHGHVLAVTALTIAGIVLVIDGATGLAG
jgi:Sap, sulfolipid-1-addressing protein